MKLSGVEKTKNLELTAKKCYKTFAVIKTT